MVVAQHEVISLILYLDQREAHQRSVLEVEAACEIGGEELRELLLLECRIKGAPVE